MAASKLLMVSLAPTQYTINNRSSATKRTTTCTQYPIFLVGSSSRQVPQTRAMKVQYCVTLWVTTWVYDGYLSAGKLLLLSRKARKFWWCVYLEMQEGKFTAASPPDWPGESQFIPLHSNCSWHMRCLPQRLDCQSNARRGEGVKIKDEVRSGIMNLKLRGT